MAASPSASAPGARAIPPVNHVIVQASDGIKLQIPLKIAFRSGVIKKKFLEQPDVQSDGSVLISNVPGHALNRIMEYCRLEWPPEPSVPDNLSIVPPVPVTAKPTVPALPPPDCTFHSFVLKAPPATLCELASAAYHLDVKPLVDLTCRAIAETIKGKSPDEIRSTFNITNDFSQEEEEQVRRSVLERTMMLPPASWEHDVSQTIYSAREAAKAQQKSIENPQLRRSATDPSSVRPPGDPAAAAALTRNAVAAAQAVTAFSVRSKLKKRLEELKQQQATPPAAATATPQPVANSPSAAKTPAAKPRAHPQRSDTRSVDELLKFIEDEPGKKGAKKKKKPKKKKEDSEGPTTAASPLSFDGGAGDSVATAEPEAPKSFSIADDSSKVPVPSPEPAPTAQKASPVDIPASVPAASPPSAPPVNEALERLRQQRRNKSAAAALDGAAGPAPTTTLRETARQAGPRLQPLVTDESKAIEAAVTPSRSSVTKAPHTPSDRDGSAARELSEASSDAEEEAEGEDDDEDDPVVASFKQSLQQYRATQAGTASKLSLAPSVRSDLAKVARDTKLRKSLQPQPPSPSPSPGHSATLPDNPTSLGRSSSSPVPTHTATASVSSSIASAQDESDPQFPSASRFLEDIKQQIAVLSRDFDDFDSQEKSRLESTAAELSAADDALPTDSEDALLDEIAIAPYLSAASVAKNVTDDLISSLFSLSPSASFPSDVLLNLRRRVLVNSGLQVHATLGAGSDRPSNDTDSGASSPAHDQSTASSTATVVLDSKDGVVVLTVENSQLSGINGGTPSQALATPADPQPVFSAKGSQSASNEPFSSPRTLPPVSKPPSSASPHPPLPPAKPSSSFDPYSRPNPFAPFPVFHSAAPAGPVPAPAPPVREHEMRALRERCDALEQRLVILQKQYDEEKKRRRAFQDELNTFKFAEWHARSLETDSLVQRLSAQLAEERKARIDLEDWTKRKIQALESVLILKPAQTDAPADGAPSPAPPLSSPAASRPAPIGPPQSIAPQRSMLPSLPASLLSTAQLMNERQSQWGPPVAAVGRGGGGGNRELPLFARFRE